MKILNKSLKWPYFTVYKNYNYYYLRFRMFVYIRPLYNSRFAYSVPYSHIITPCAAREFICVPLHFNSFVDYVCGDVVLTTSI
jgi:hypothetical protein